MKLRDLFKSKERKHREKLLKDYEEGKILKIETPEIKIPKTPQSIPLKNKKKKKKHKWRNK